MNEENYSKTGIYISYPTSPVLKSIYKAGGYKTKVNDRHTKVGKAENGFKNREGQYLGNFDNEAKFIPIVYIDNTHLKHAEEIVLSAIKSKFSTVGHAKEWFDTLDRKKISEIVINTLDISGIKYEAIQSIENNDG